MPRSTSKNCEQNDLQTPLKEYNSSTKLTPTSVTNYVTPKRRISTGTGGDDSEKTKKKRKRVETEVRARPYIDATLEENLHECAKKNQLSPSEMKKLLKKLVTNEHVVALVRLQEEEDETKKDEPKPKEINNTRLRRRVTQAEPKTTDEDTSPEKSFEKQTRSKTKQKLKAPIMLIPSLVEPVPGPELVALVQDKLHSDEEDEEYQLNEDDYLTDDDPNVTYSDMDSQPRTPYVPSPAKGLHEGVLNVSRQRNDSVSSTHEEKIATRTRSKFSLQETPIEVIEGSFKPPDVFYDTKMYESDEGEGETLNWKQFLEEFAKPMICADDDDPELDPEYVAAEKVPVDAEELRDVNIPKKELNDLVNELFEEFEAEGIMFEEFQDLDTPSKILEHLTSETASMCAASISPKKKLRLIGSPRPPGNAIGAVENVSSGNILAFQPNIMSTPQCTAGSRPSIFETSKYPCSNNNNQFDHHSTLYSYPSASQYHTPSVSNRLPQILESSHIDPPLETSVPRATNGTPKKTQPKKSRSLNTSNASRYISSKAIIKREYKSVFEALRSVNVPEEHFDDDATGWTSTQKELVEQQLRIHVQMCSQNFLQLYAHPEHWPLANAQKDMLKETDDAIKKSFLKVWNLAPALELVEEWEGELSDDTPENRNFMTFLQDEIERVNTKTNIYAKNLMRFAPRVMKKILDSPVFIYPEYLPRMPFLPKSDAPTDFCPSESFLLALGLDRHLKSIEKNEMHLSYMKRRSALTLACERIDNHFIYTKNPRRIYDYIKQQQKNVEYNPIKYYFEKGRAPPFNHTIIPIDFNNVATPNERFSELPESWKEFSIALHAIEINKTCPSVSFNKYLDELTPLKPDPKPQRKGRSRKPSFESIEEEAASQSIVVNFNYIFNTSGLDKTISSKQDTICNFEFDNSLRIAKIEPLFPDSVKKKASHVQKVLSDFFPVKKPPNLIKTNESSELDYCATEASTIEPLNTLIFEHTDETKNLPDVDNLTNVKSYDSESTLADDNPWSDDELDVPAKPHTRKRKSHPKCNWRRALPKKLTQVAKKYRKSKSVRNKFEKLVNCYEEALLIAYKKYKNNQIREVFWRFKILDLYSNLLVRLKMNCKKMKNEESGKKIKAIEEEATKSKKAHRQEENFKHMLLPESWEESNKKDAIFAYNFYEKVEETFTKANKPDDFKKFERILKMFDPSRSKVSDLYSKIENLFLPEHPELAETFLTFLLPSEANEVGKFFEHFMLTNMTSFITKLNIYFNKQPAQIRKIYNCLQELSDDPEVTMDKIKTKILPLMRGNQFLVEWFLQIFPSETPPERLLTASERVNLKEIDTSTVDGNICEHFPASELLEDNGENSHCQLKYVNGRLYYGSKIQLPAKLAFMAEDLGKHNKSCSAVDEDEDEEDNNEVVNTCVHGIREYGEQKLRTAMPETSCDETDKSEDEEVMKESTDLKSFNICDEAAVRAHSIRLNPSLYQTDNDASPHIWTNVLCRSKLYEDGKISPRKSLTSKERRKSPKKTIIKSPVGTKRAGTSQSLQESTSNAIITAKKLKALVSDGDSSISEAESSSVSPNVSIQMAEDAKNEDVDPDSSATSLELAMDSEVEDSAEEPSQEESSAWIREEDKIILQEVNSGFDCEESLINRIMQQMPNRSKDEIMGRHEFLMDILSKLQGAE